MTHIIQSRNSEQLTQFATECDQFQGLLSAAIILVEYGDYQCPHCKEANTVIQQVQQKFGSELCFVFRHFPLTQIHPQARQAAEAAETASKQGMFWQMHEKLFAGQQTLGDGYLVQYANDLGLNMSRFLWNFSQHIYGDRVQSNFLSGVESGVTGTPTFFINNVRLADSWKLENLMAAINKSTAF
jgi:protein-disulfide isomerase